MNRSWACALLIACADLLIGSAHAPHFTGGSLLLILFVDALLAFVLLGLPSIVAAYRCQARVLAGERCPDCAGGARERAIAAAERANDDQVFATVTAVRGEQ
jgi:hypothetical protein